MPLLNYTTTVGVDKTIGELHALLVKAGARQIMTDYEAGGIPTGLVFTVETAYGPRSFALPVNARSVLKILWSEKVERRYRTEAHAQRVAWRILKDWVEAQLALTASGMAALDQIMLPYMRDAQTGTTVYDLYSGQQLALAAGDERSTK